MRYIPLIVLLLAPLSPGQSHNSGKVVEVVDGDNLVVQTANNPKLRIRLAAIDAPELDQAFGDDASTYLSKLALERAVKFTSFKIESTGRYVAKVMVGDTDLALEMVKNGYAWHNGERSESNTADAELYMTAHISAKEKKLGLWAGEKPQEPWVWKRGMRLPPLSQLARDAPKPLGVPVVGVVTTKLYYALSCDEAQYNVNIQHRSFRSEDEAIEAGYRKADKCSAASTSNGDNGGSGRSAPIRTARAIKIIQVTSDIEAYKGKIVTFEGRISMSTTFVGSFDESFAYAFSLGDNTDSIIGYTPKNSGAAKLRSLLLQRDDPRGWAKVRVEILPNSTPNNTYGVLLDFYLYPDED